MFRQVIGVDPSEPMVIAAQRQTNSPNIKYVQGQAEDLKGIIEADSVDLLISGSSHNYVE